jgi:uncharacterized integral membrane protein
MVRKVLAALVLVPLVIVLVLFAVANRQTVTVSFDPFSTLTPAYAASLPLFVLIFVLVVIGILIGGTAAWLGQGKWRRAVRRLDAQTRQMNEEIRELRRRGDSEHPLAALPPR